MSTSHSASASASASSASASHSAPTNTFFSTVLNHPSPHNLTSPHRSFGGGGGAAAGFTPTQRSLQARNKEYNSVGKGEESYEMRQRREEAAVIVESVEMLIWWSGARNESIPQTRRHFQNIVLGIMDPETDVLWREEWETENSDHAGGGVGSTRGASAVGKGKAKRRVGSGSASASGSGMDGRW